MIKHTCIKKGLSVFLSVFYFAASVVMGSSFESNFWKERNSKLASLSNNAALFTNLPRLAPPSQNTVVNLKSWDSEPQFIRPLLKTLPLKNVKVRDIQLNGSPQTPAVVLIQDVHLNAEAQMNIAETIEVLVESGAVGSVGVEGAFGEFVFDELRSLGDEARVLKTAGSFLKENQIGAPSYVGLTADYEGIPFFGLDNREAYEKNVQAYLGVQKNRAAINHWIQQENNNLNEKKLKIYSPRLLEFDDKQSAYRKNKLSFGDFASYLAPFSSASSVEVSNFLAALRFEKLINYSAVEKERTVLLNTLTQRMTPKGVNNLIIQTQNYKEGKIGFGEFYRHLGRLMEAHDLNLNGSPAFKQYLDYIELSEKLNPENLISEMERLEKMAAVKLIETKEEQRLVDQSDVLFLLSKVSSFTSIPSEWDAYKNLKSHLSKTDNPAVQQAIHQAELFYELAEERSQLMAEKWANRPKSGPTLLITGGFHTPHLKKYFADRGISTITLAPQLASVDLETGSSYLSIFEKEKMPLENIMSNESLWLNPASLVLGDPVAQNPRVQKVTNKWRTSFGIDQKEESPELLAAKKNVAGALYYPAGGTDIFPFQGLLKKFPKITDVVYMDLEGQYISGTDLPSAGFFILSSRLVEEKAQINKKSAAQDVYEVHLPGNEESLGLNLHLLEGAADKVPVELKRLALDGSMTPLPIGFILVKVPGLNSSLTNGNYGPQFYGQLLDQLEDGGLLGVYQSGMTAPPLQFLLHSYDSLGLKELGYDKDDHIHYFKKRRKVAPEEIKKFIALDRRLSPLFEKYKNAKVGGWNPPDTQDVINALSELQTIISPSDFQTYLYLFENNKYDRAPSIVAEFKKTESPLGQMAYVSVAGLAPYLNSSWGWAPLMGLAILALLAAPFVIYFWWFKSKPVHPTSPNTEIARFPYETYPIRENDELSAYFWDANKFKGVENEDTPFISKNRMLAMVLDGISNPRGGHYASRIAGAMVAKGLLDSMPQSQTTLDIIQRVIKAVNVANFSITRASFDILPEGKVTLHGIGTTLALTVAFQQKNSQTGKMSKMVFVLSLGDVHVNLIRQGSKNLEQLTLDDDHLKDYILSKRGWQEGDTFIEDQFDMAAAIESVVKNFAPFGTESEIARIKSHIRNDVGNGLFGRNLNLHLYNYNLIEVREGDTLLLMSDGAYKGQPNNASIVATVQKNPRASEHTRILGDEAMTSGLAYDDISIISLVVDNTFGADLVVAAEMNNANPPPMTILLKRISNNFELDNVNKFHLFDESVHFLANGQEVEIYAKSGIPWLTVKSQIESENYDGPLTPQDYYLGKPELQYEVIYGGVDTGLYIQRQAGQITVYVPDEWDFTLYSKEVLLYQMDGKKRPIPLEEITSPIFDGKKTQVPEGDQKEEQTDSEMPLDLQISSVDLEIEVLSNDSENLIDSPVSDDDGGEGEKLSHPADNFDLTARAAQIENMIDPNLSAGENRERMRGLNLLYRLKLITILYNALKNLDKNNLDEHELRKALTLAQPEIFKNIAQIRTVLSVFYLLNNEKVLFVRLNQFPSCDSGLCEAVTNAALHAFLLSKFELIRTSERRTTGKSPRHVFLEIHRLPSQSPAAPPKPKDLAVDLAAGQFFSPAQEEGMVVVEELETHVRNLTKVLEIDSDLMTHLKDWQKQGEALFENVKPRRDALSTNPFPPVDDWFKSVENLNRELDAVMAEGTDKNITDFEEKINNLIEQGLKPKITEDASAAVAENKTKPALEIQKPRILLVEDTEIMATTFSDYLEVILNVDVVHAWNGKQGLAVLDNDSVGFDLIISDYDMPELNGKDFYLALQKSQFSVIPFLFHSANASEKIVRETGISKDLILYKLEEPKAKRQKINEMLQKSPRGSAPNEPFMLGSFALLAAVDWSLNGAAIFMAAPVVYILWNKHRQKTRELNFRKQLVSEAFEAPLIRVSDFMKSRGQVKTPTLIYQILKESSDDAAWTEMVSTRPSNNGLIETVYVVDSEVAAGRLNTKIKQNNLSHVRVVYKSLNDDMLSIVESSKRAAVNPLGEAFINSARVHIFVPDSWQVGEKFFEKFETAFENRFDVYFIIMNALAPTLQRIENSQINMIETLRAALTNA